MSISHTHTAIKTTYYSIAANVCLAVVKWLTGYFGNSYALIADAIESTSDVLASIVVLVGLRYANRPADQNHPYGHGRAEPLITFMVVAFLVISATVIVYNSIQNILNPHGAPESFTLIVLGAIIIWKELSFQFVKKRSKQTKSSVLMAEAWHHRSDAVTSVAAFIGISIALVFGNGFEAADDWAAIFAAGFILYHSYRIFRPALGEIMDEHVHDELIKEIRHVAMQVEGVLATEKCFVRKAGMVYHIDLHAEVHANLTVREGHDIAHQLKETLRKTIPQLGHVLIHIEPFEKIDSLIH